MSTHRMVPQTVVAVGLCLLVVDPGVGTAGHGDSRPSQAPTKGQTPPSEVQPGEHAISKATEQHLPGNRMVIGRIDDIRSDQMIIDIGHPQPLFVPLQPAREKGQQFKPGDSIVVTLNDHNAVVDYHPPGEEPDHRVIRGHLTTPLTVGLDKAVIETGQGTSTFMVADRAKGKLTAIPVGVEALFLADETGRLVDAQLASTEAVAESGRHNKAHIKGAHDQLRARYQGAGKEGHIKIETSKEGVREVPYRPPLAKMEQLKAGQDVVLLLDDEGYVLEIASPDVKPVR